MSTSIEPVEALDRDSERLELFIKKDFEKLLNARHFLKKVTDDDGGYSYQVEKKRNFETAKSAAMK